MAVITPMNFTHWLKARTARERWRLAFLGLALLFACLAFITYYTNVALKYYFDPTRNNPPDQVVLLTTAWCPFCKALKASMASAQMPYKEIDIESDWRSELAFQSTNRRGIPVTIIGDAVIEGGLQRQLAAIRMLCEKRHSQRTGVDCGQLK